MTANLKANVHATGNHKDMPVFQRLQPLLGAHPAPCLSLYQPTFRQFPDSQQNRVRYRNLVRDLREAVQQKHRGIDVDAMLEPFERLAEDNGFWAHPQDGIAVFAAQGFWHVEKVQQSVPELVVVNDHLLLKPLVRIFQSEDTYQILAIDRQEIRMYQGNRYVLDEIVMAPSVPRTIEEALGPAVALQGVQSKGDYGRGPSRPNAPAGAMFHGHGGKMDEPRLDMERFFRDVQSFVKVHGDNVNVSGRLLSVDGFSLGAGPAGFPSVTAKITATAYLRSPGDDDTTTGTDAGGSSSTGTTPPGASTAPTGGTASEVAR